MECADQFDRSKPLAATSTGDRGIAKRGRIHPVLKIGFVLFTIVHAGVNVPYYGASTYLWFCDLTLLLSCIGIVLESRLLLSMCAVSSLGPSIVWTADLLCRLFTHHWLVGLAAYMGAKQLPLAIRLVSTFHLWLPLALIYCLRQLRYDRRAIIYQTILAISLLIFCRVATRPPPGNGPVDNVNINFVYGSSDIAPQTALPAWLYLTRMIVLCWVLMYLPLHLALCYFLDPRSRPARELAGANPTHPAASPAFDPRT